MEGAISSPPQQMVIALEVQENEEELGSGPSNESKQNSFCDSGRDADALVTGRCVVKTNYGFI